MKGELAPHTPKVREATEREREMERASGESPVVCERERASREGGGKTLRNKSKEEGQKKAHRNIKKTQTERGWGRAEAVQRRKPLLVRRRPPSAVQPELKLAQLLHGPRRRLTAWCEAVRDTREKYEPTERSQMNENDIYIYIYKYVSASKTKRREMFTERVHTARAQRFRLPSKQSRGFRAARLKTGSVALESEVGEGYVWDRGDERSGVWSSSAS